MLLVRAWRRWPRNLLVRAGGRRFICRCPPSVYRALLNFDWARLPDDIDRVSRSADSAPARAWVRRYLESLCGAFAEHGGEPELLIDVYGCFYSCRLIGGAQRPCGGIVLDPVDAGCFRLVRFVADNGEELFRGTVETDGCMYRLEVLRYVGRKGVVYYVKWLLDPSSPTRCFLSGPLQNDSMVVWWRREVEHPERCLLDSIRNRDVLDAVSRMLPGSGELRELRDALRKALALHDLLE